MRLATVRAAWKVFDKIIRRFPDSHGPAGTTPPRGNFFYQPNLFGPEFVSPVLPIRVGKRSQTWHVHTPRWASRHVSSSVALCLTKRLQTPFLSFFRFFRENCVFSDRCGNEESSQIRSGSLVATNTSAPERKGWLGSLHPMSAQATMWRNKLHPCRRHLYRYVVLLPGQHRSVRPWCLQRKLCTTNRAAGRPFSSCCMSTSGVSYTN